MICNCTPESVCDRCVWSPQPQGMTQDALRDAYAEIDRLRTQLAASERKGLELAALHLEGVIPESDAEGSYTQRALRMILVEQAERIRALAKESK